MSQEKSRKILLLVAILLISLNLRPAITAVGPLISEIRLDTGLSSSALGLLTTLPVLGFGLISVLTPLFTRKIGSEGTMLFALTLLTCGIFLRIRPSVIALYSGTIMLGVGIALGNVLLPGIVKKQFPEKAGAMTGIYSAALGIGATVASGASVPLSETYGLLAMGIRCLGIFSSVRTYILVATDAIKFPGCLKKRVPSVATGIGVF